MLTPQNVQCPCFLRNILAFFAGLSFRTTEESLRSAFEKFGRLVDGESSLELFSVIFLHHIFENLPLFMNYCAEIGTVYATE